MNKLDISAVSPQAGVRFSPKLHAWLKKNHGKKGSPPPEVFYLGLGSKRERPDVGFLWVGYKFEGDFIGSPLIHTSG